MPEVKVGEEVVTPTITKGEETVEEVNVKEAGVYTLTYTKDGYNDLVITVTVTKITKILANVDNKEKVVENNKLTLTKDTKVDSITIEFCEALSKEAISKIRGLKFDNTKGENKPERDYFTFKATTKVEEKDGKIVTITLTDAVAGGVGEFKMSLVDEKGTDITAIDDIKLPVVILTVSDK